MERMREVNLPQMYLTKTVCNHTKNHSYYWLVHEIINQQLNNIE